MRGVTALGTFRHLIRFRPHELKFFLVKFGPETVGCICEMTVINLLKALSLVSDFKLKSSISRFSKITEFCVLQNTCNPMDACLGKEFPFC